MKLAASTLPIVWIICGLASAGEAPPAITLKAIADATLSSNGEGPGGTHASFRLMGEAENIVA